MPNWIERLIGETQAKLLRLLRRSNQTITTLADALGLTDNAVRTHVAVLGRDGIVAEVGTHRDTGGKPARVYGLTKEGEELFPKAYALVLGELVAEIARKDGWPRALRLLRAVGRQIASEVPDQADPGARVAAAAAALRRLGGDIDVHRQGQGWRLQGHGCPLSAVTAQHAQVCTLAKALVEEVTGRTVVECCERGPRPNCGFRVAE